MVRVCIKYDPNKKLPTHKSLIPNQIGNDIKAMAINELPTNKSNQNLTTSQKYLLQYSFRLVCIGFQHVKWSILTGCIKLQVSSKEVANC